MKAVSLKCLNCGAGLEVKPDIEDFACGYCGVQQHVERSGGIVSLRRVEETLDEVKLSTNRAASELALTRLRSDLSAIRARRDNEVIAVRKLGSVINTLMGWGLFIVAVYGLTQFDLWAVPIIIAGLIFVIGAIGPRAKRIKRIEASAEARMEPLRVQIERHQAIIDSYDFGTPAENS